MTRRRFLIGLTGSIGMGKSTTAAMFSARGIPVWDADAAVARLYENGGGAVPAIGKLLPQAVVDGAVSKAELRQAIRSNPAVLAQIEAIVHPLVRQDREDFIRTTPADILVLDIPLLFETGSEAEFDLVVVVSAPEAIQRERVLSRPGMTEDQFNLIRSKQLPDAEKRARADFVIETVDMETANRGVDAVVKIAQDSLRHA